MWRIDTPWFDVAVIGVSFAVGNILFGRFEDHKPRYRRIVKLVVTIALTLVLAQTVGRAWAYGWMIPLLLLVIWVHGVWLPRNGVNGWTAEPRDRYFELLRNATLRDVFRRTG
jgi:predicted MFS family arabinose efflux permease